MNVSSLRRLRVLKQLAPFFRSLSFFLLVVSQPGEKKSLNNRLGAALTLKAKKSWGKNNFIFYLFFFPFMMIIVNANVQNVFE